MTGLLLAGIAAILAPTGRSAALALAPMAVAMAPGPALLALTTGACLVGFHRHRQRPTTENGSVAELARLTALGVTAGLSLRSSLALAASHAGSRPDKRMSGYLRSHGQAALRAALEADERDLEELFRIVVRSDAVGSPAAESLAALASDLERRELHRLRSDAKRLPIKLMLPLALLILPGFVLLALGPPLLDALDRLSAPF